MRIDDLWTEVEVHVKAAHHALPIEDREVLNRQGLDYWYEAGDWEQVFAWLWNRRERSNLPLRFFDELAAANEAVNEYGRAGMRSVLDGLNAWEKRVIGECLRAAAYGPFFRETNPDAFWAEEAWDSDFETIFGLTGEEVARVADLWPGVDASDETVYPAINGSINHLFGYPHGKHHLWSEHISATPQEVADVYNWFKRLAGKRRSRPRPTSPGHEYFLNLT